MKKFDKIFCIMALLCLFVIRANAQSNIYLKLSGINGDVTTPAAYANSISLSSYQGGTGRAVTTSGGTTTPSAAPSVAEISITMPLGSGSLPLLNNMYGKPSAIATADFYFLNPTCSCPYYRVHLENVYVTGFSESSGGDTPANSATLHFDKIAWAYYKANSSTITNTTGYNLVTGQAYSYSFP